MTSSISSQSTDDFAPRGCIICGNPDIGWGALCHDHVGLGAWAVWVDEGLISDWDPHLGRGVCVEALNHRTMLLYGPLGLGADDDDPDDAHDPDPDAAPTGWLDQFAVIVRRFGYWLGFDADHTIPDDPWPGLPL